MQIPSISLHCEDRFRSVGISLQCDVDNFIPHIIAKEKLNVNFAY